MGTVEGYADKSWMCLWVQSCDTQFLSKENYEMENNLFIMLFSWVVGQ